MLSTVSLGIAGSIDSLEAQFLSGHPLLAGAKAAPSLAVVFAAGARADVRTSLLEVLDNSRSVSTFDAVPGVTPGLLMGGLRRGHWKNVDVDERAPRLRTVRLPASLAESDAIVGASDLRVIGRARPLIALGLWAPLAAPIQRIGSLLTGAREGLTAEIGLAVRPAAFVVWMRLTATGPLIAIVSSDPIATELTALAIWQSRLPTTADLPGPWEDSLVQRATELGLGVTQPSQIIVETWFGSDLTGDDISRSRDLLAGALSLVGVGRMFPDHS